MHLRKFLLAATVWVTALIPAAHAQWLDYPTPNVPKTKDGKPDLAASAPRLNGHPDFSGMWGGDAITPCGSHCDDLNIATEFINIAAKLVAIDGEPVANAGGRGAGPGAAKGAGPGGGGAGGGKGFDGAPGGAPGGGKGPGGPGGEGPGGAKGGPGAVGAGGPGVAAGGGRGGFGGGRGGFGGGRGGFGGLFGGGAQLPYTDWGRQTMQARSSAGSVDDPNVHCMPRGLPRLWTDDYYKRIFMASGAMLLVNERNMSFRQIHMDGRPLPKDPDPTWNGYSTAEWDGDTLVVHSIGFRDDLWLDSNGNPLTETGKVTERISRPNFGTLVIEMTIEDPKAYTKPWTVRITNPLVLDSELIDYYCLDNEKDAQHMGSSWATPAVPKPGNQGKGQAK